VCVSSLNYSSFRVRHETIFDRDMDTIENTNYFVYPTEIPQLPFAWKYY